MARGSSGYVILISAVAAIGGFLFGFDSGVINGAVGALSRAFGSSAFGTGFSVASMLLGCAVGAVVAGPLADRHGRRPLLAATAVLFLVSAWGSGVAQGSVEFVAYRLIGGAAVGGASVLCPAYISEVAPARLRGRLASLQQLAIVLGLLAAFLSNYALVAAFGGADLPAWGGHATFRWMFWIELLPAAAFLLGVVLIPESPRFLVRVGRVQQARAVFGRASEDDPEGLLQAVKMSVDRERRPRLRDLLDRHSGRILPIVWVGVALSVFQQFVGINVVFYYGEVLWRAAGFTEEQALEVNLLGGAVNVISTFVAIALIDKIGRKPLLLGGSLGMTLTLGIMTFCFAQARVVDGSLVLGETLSVVALVSANAYVFCFGVSWGPCVWVLLGEMFPNSIRGAALGVAASAQWVANFAVTMTFPVFLTSIGLAGAYGLYATCALVSALFVARFVLETKGRTLEQLGAR